MMFEGIIVEALLSVVLLFNVSAFTFLWKKSEGNAEDIDNLETGMAKLFKRIFGMDEDPTDEGHLVETKRGFQKLNERLDCIEDKIDKTDSERRKEHRKVQNRLDAFIDEVTNSEELDIDGKKFR